MMMTSLRTSAETEILDMDYLIIEMINFVDDRYNIYNSDALSRFHEALRLTKAGLSD